MIVMYKGRRGCGKTLTMVKDALNFYQKGWTIYSNFNIEIPYKKLTNDDLINLVSNDKIRDCVLLVDEIQLLIDSRRSQRKENLNFSYFIQQIRKKGIILLCTTQFTKTTDVRLREHVDIVVKPKIIPQYPVVECEYIDITAEEDDILGLPVTKIVIYNPLPLFELYDTEEIKNPVETKKEKVKT